MASVKKIDNAVLKRFERVEKSRSEKTKSKRVYFLIVCEGERTEPLYFEALQRTLPIGTVELQIEGSGKNTLSLVEEAIKIRDKSSRKFDRVWAVFDKDSFPSSNFNSAITKGKSNNIECAWTNEAFELWFLLHFMYRNTSMNRDEYKDALEKEIQKRSGNKKYKYQKKDQTTYQLINKYGSQADAIANAEKLVALYNDENFANHNPCTYVHELVKELTNPEYIIDKLGLHED